RLKTLIESIANRMGMQNFTASAFVENPERPELPCAKFGNVVIWAFPKGGVVGEGEIVWMVDYVRDTFSNVSGPGETDPKEIISGVSVFDAIRAGFKIHLDERLASSIEMEKGIADLEEETTKKEGLPQ